MKSRKIQIFETSIQRLGRILSKKWKIKVVFKHNECKTDGRTIYLPTLPDNANRDLMNACHGHLDHEAAHVVFSNFEILKHAKLVNFPKTLLVVNAMEDPRIEKKWVEVYPGAKLNLRRSSEFALKKTAEEREMVDPEDGQIKKMRPWDTMTKFGQFIHTAIVYTINGFSDDHWFLRDVVDPDVLADVKKYGEDLFRQALDATNTADVIPLAKELLRRLNEDDPEVQQPPQLTAEDLEKAEIVSNPNGSQQQQSAQDSAMFKQPKGGAQDGKKQIVLQPSGDTEQTGKYRTDESGMERDESATNRHEALRDAAQKEVSDVDSYLVYTTEGDKVERITNGDRARYSQFKGEANSLVAPMKRRLARAMLSTKQSRWEGDKLRGKINPRRVYQVATGTSKRVFRERIEATEYDTCVLLMVDHSGSMAGEPLDLAAKASIVFGEVLNQLNIPFAVLGFSTGSSSVAADRFYGASEEEQGVYKRWGNLWIGEYKGFDDSWASAGPRMINMKQNGKINTYDGEALKYGAQVLLGRPEKRKIMFWLNDGYPCPNGADDSAAHRRYTSDCAKEVEKMIELFAIGIMTDAVKQFYSNAVRLNEIADLPKVCLTELDQLIRKGKSYRR